MQNSGCPGTLQPKEKIKKTSYKKSKEVELIYLE
jgi:hypothetical protein